MDGYLKKATIGVAIIIAGGLLLSTSVNAATLEDAKKSVLSGKGEMVHPNLHRESTDEETKANNNVPYQVSRKMTQEEAAEYFSYIDKYQSQHHTVEVPDNAYDYIQYITEKLDVSETKEITNELRLEAEKYVDEYKQDSSKNEVPKVKQDNSKNEVSKVKQNNSKNEVSKKTSLWTKFLKFLNM